MRIGSVPHRPVVERSAPPPAAPEAHRRETAPSRAQAVTATLNRYSPTWRHTFAGVAGVAGDVVALAGAALATALTPAGVGAPAAVLMLLALAATVARGDRRAWGLRGRRDDLSRTTIGLLTIGSAAVAGAASVGAEAESWWHPAVPVLTVALAVPVVRSAVRACLVATLGPERVVLIGRGPCAERLARDLTCRRDVELVARLAGAEGLHALAADRVDHVVAGEGLAPEAIMQVLLTCQDHVGRVSIAANRPRALPLVSGVRLDGVTLLAARSPAAPMGHALKRGLDVIGAALALVALAPVMAVIAVLVRVQSRGPALFRQTRVGRHGRIFVMFKFRTMVADAEERRAALLPLSRDPGWLHLRHDPRITSVGRLLRRTSLDELPQLWNVVRGDMSLVGPRPLIPLEHERAPGWAHARSQVRPGITGLWQVEGRTAVPFRDMLRLDQAYVATWSLRRDAEILLRTVPTVLTAKGAN